MDEKIIKDEDILGRAVFSNKRAKKASEGKIRDSIFLEKLGKPLSVDRFGLCSEETLTHIQNKNAESRKKPFYGWASVEARRARENNRRVKATPIKLNPYHADIILPEGIDREKQKAHARELASNSAWTPK